MEEELKSMREQLEAAEAAHEKFKNGNASAGTRLRGHMQSIKESAQRVRVEVQTIKNAKKG